MAMHNTISSLIPARMDRLPWTRFHTRMILALGVTWILDGVEIALASSIGDVLRHPEVLGFSSEMVGLSASVYLLGEVVGALYFGSLADRLGRRRLFIATLALYLFANGLTAFSFSAWFFFLTRFFAGMGIGGEYAAIHSAIDELTPARYRGRVDIAVAGTYWGGAMLAAAAQILLLDPSIFPIDWGWRLGLGIGPLVGMMIWGLRHHLPESPRWLVCHGRAEEAEQIVSRIEVECRKTGCVLAEVRAHQALQLTAYQNTSYLAVLKVLLARFRSRVVLGLCLMITQSFLYNAIFFTYAIILVDFYDVKTASIPYYIFPFALGNLLGPFVLGPLFDTWGRRRMIASTYLVSGLLLGLNALLFSRGLLDATTQTWLWCVIFFIASAAASSAYLTVSELFPLEMRSRAIALFFSVAQLFGGVIAPAIFGFLIATRSREALALGTLVGAGLMVVGAVVAALLGVDAERKSLETL